MHLTYIYTNSKADVQGFFLKIFFSFLRFFQHLCSSDMLIGFKHFLALHMFKSLANVQTTLVVKKRTKKKGEQDV